MNCKFFLISLKDIIGWVVTILVAVAIYWLFQENQLKIARHKIIRLLEEDIAKIFSTKSAQLLIPSLPERHFESREFRSVLDNIPPWIFESDQNSTQIAGWQPPISCFIDGQKHWLIRRIKNEENTEQYLSSQALQETLLWFRRILQAYRDKVVRAVDLAILWRFILPFGFSGRPTYFSKYFQGEEEIQEIIYVINETICYCYKKKWRKSLTYLNEYVTEEDRQILTREKRYLKLHKQLSVMFSK